jgi:hypothetical protein
MGEMGAGVGTLQNHSPLSKAGRRQFSKEATQRLGMPSFRGGATRIASCSPVLRHVSLAEGRRIHQSAKGIRNSL